MLTTPKNLAELVLAATAKVTIKKLIPYQTQVKNKNTTGWPLLKQLVECFTKGSHEPAFEIQSDIITGGSMLLVNTETFEVPDSLKGVMYGRFTTVSQTKLQAFLEKQEPVAA